MFNCPYCGNSSGMRDKRGMCISCGGNLEKITQPLEMKYPYSGSSGGFIFLSPYTIGEDEIEVINFGVPYA